MNYLDILHAELSVDEDVRSKPYDDVTGRELPPGSKVVGNITIGCGRNLFANGVNRGEIALMFDNDLAAAEHVARLLLTGFDSLSDVRKAAFMNMAFAMGYTTMAGFVNTLKAANEKRWNDVAIGVLASKWAKTPGDREERVAESIRTNIWREPQ
jgi:hypothetical protein